MNQKILVGVAWPYVNGDLHLGHLAGYLLPADIFARYQRIAGNDVLMVSGSDCHGTPITVEADKSHMVPADVVTKYHAQDLQLFKDYDLSYNLYTTTTTENHKTVVQQMFLDLLKNGYIVKDVMKQYYSEADKQFLPDRYVEGTCPHCNAKEQRSDQCESCGRWLADGELLNPVSKLTKSVVSLQDTEHYFLDFEKLVPELRKYVDNHKDTWRHWVWNETDSWLNEGLRKRAITRDMDWAVELPIAEIQKLEPEKQLKDFSGKKIYVWFEAVIGYLSAAIEWSQHRNNGDQPDTNTCIYYTNKGQSLDWKDWWLNPDARIFNFMGQDNLVFHTLMWPGQLMGAGKGYTLPENVVVNKFFNLEGKKFSKSRHWSIDSGVMAKKYPTDLVRYYIAANFPENKEGDFTWAGFADSVNNELVANLGNFINRTLKFYEAKFNGQLPETTSEIDNDVKTAIIEAIKNTGEHLDKAEFVLALESIMLLSRFGNKYFDDHKVWEVIKTDTNQAAITMKNLLNLVGALQVLIIPFFPVAAKKLANTFTTSEISGDFAPEVGVNKWQYQISQSFKLLQPVEILFNKLDKAVVLAEKDTI